MKTTSERKATNPKSHGVSDAELAYVASPQRLEVIGHADLAAAVHLGRLAVQLGYGDLGRRRRICHGHVELDGELVLEQLVHVPALAEPLGAVAVGLESEPVVVGRLVVLDVLDERAVLLLEAFGPGVLLARTCPRLQQRDRGERLLRYFVNHF